VLAEVDDITEREVDEGAGLEDMAVVKKRQSATKVIK
jgi:hypothetical protein